MNSNTDKAQNGSTLEKYEEKVPWIAHSIVTLVILAFAALVVSGLFSTKPTANRWGDKPAASVAVEVSPLEVESCVVLVD
jgi:hypothetical protein